MEEGVQGRFAKGVFDRMGQEQPWLSVLDLSGAACAAFVSASTANDFVPPRWLQDSDGFILVYAYDDLGSVPFLDELEMALHRAKDAELIPVTIVANKDDLSDELRRVKPDAVTHISAEFRSTSSVVRQFDCSEQRTSSAETAIQEAATLVLLAGSAESSLTRDRGRTRSFWG